MLPASLQISSPLIFRDVFFFRTRRRITQTCWHLLEIFFLTFESTRGTLTARAAVSLRDCLVDLWLSPTAIRRFECLLAECSHQDQRAIYERIGQGRVYAPDSTVTHEAL